MKKILAIILVFSMIFCFAACGEKPSQGKDDPEKEEQSSEGEKEKKKDCLYSGVTTTTLTVRKEPATNAKSIRKLSKGDAVTAYEEAYSNGYSWLRIGEGEWIANDGTWVDITYDGSMEAPKDGVISQSELKAYLSGILGTGDYFFESTYLLEADQIKDNASYLSNYAPLLFFCSGMETFSMHGLSSNKDEMNFGTNGYEISDLVTKGIVTQTEADQLLQASGGDGYISLYVKKSWLQSCMDYFYGKNVVKVSNWKSMGDWDLFTDKYMLMFGGIGGPYNYVARSTPVIESIDGKNAVVSYKCFNLEDIWEDEVGTNGYVVSDLFSGEELYSHKSFEKGVADFFSNNPTMEEICRKTGLDESSLTKRYINIFKDATGLHIKGCGTEQ